MPEYIDREDYCKNLCHCNNEYCDKESCPIWKAPAADVAPVVHGRWIGIPLCGSDDCECSECGNWCNIHVNLCGEAIQKYCPYCGAKMDRGANNAVG